MVKCKILKQILKRFYASSLHAFAILLHLEIILISEIEFLSIH